MFRLMVSFATLTLRTVLSLILNEPLMKNLSLIVCSQRDNSRKDDFVLFCFLLPIAGRMRVN